LLIVDVTEKILAEGRNKIPFLRFRRVWSAAVTYRISGSTCE